MTVETEVKKHKQPSNLWYLALVWLIFALGLGLRGKAALTTSVWLDDAFSIVISQTSWHDLFFQTGSYWDYAHPTGWYLLLKALSQLSSHHLFLRSLSLLMFCLSFFFTFLITKKPSSSFYQVSCLLLLSTHPTLVNLDHQIRMYPTIIACTLAFIFTLNKAILTKRRLWIGLSYLLLTLGFYLDYAMVWVFFALGLTTLYAFFIKRKDFPQLLQILVFSALSCLPQLLVMLLHYSKAMELQGELTTFTIDWVLYTIHYYVGQVVIDIQPKWWVIMWFLFLCAVLTLSYKAYIERKLINVFIASLAGSLVASALYSFILNPIYRPRNLVTVNLVFIFGLSIALTELWSISKARLLSVVFLVLLVGGYTNASLKSYNFDTTIDWSSISKQIQPSDKVIYFGERDHETSPLTIYYSPGREIIYLKPEVEVNQLPEIPNTKKVILVSFDQRERFEQTIQDELCHNNSCTIFSI